MVGKRKRKADYIEDDYNKKIKISTSTNQINNYKDKLRSRSYEETETHVNNVEQESLSDADYLTSGNISYEHNVSIFPGIDGRSQQRLAAAGITRAYVLLGKFVSLGRDPVMFQTWLHDITELPLTSAQQCCDALAKYFIEFISE